MNQISTTVNKSQTRETLLQSNNGKYKTCPQCGQNRIPFKMGICICGYQVTNITYIKNPEKFAGNYYLETDGYDTAIEETFAGITTWD